MGDGFVVLVLVLVLVGVVGVGSSIVAQCSS